MRTSATMAKRALETPFERIDAFDIGRARSCIIDMTGGAQRPIIIFRNIYCEM